jgi:hypothetical protein
MLAHIKLLTLLCVPLLAVYVQRQLILACFRLFTMYHYMFRPNWPSSGV